MQQDKQEIYMKHASYLETLSGVFTRVFDVFNRTLLPSSNDYCQKSCYMCGGECEPENVYLYGSYEADRWSGRYIFYCPAGYVFVATTLDKKDRFSMDALIAGPIVMGEDAPAADTSAGDASTGDAPAEGMRTESVSQTAYAGVTCKSTAEVGALSEVAAAVCGYVGGFPISEVDRRHQQSALHNIMYSISESERAQYPIESEAELQKYIAQGNKPRSQELLNRLLGAIYFQSGGDFKVIKARAIELIVLLSRASIQGGAQIDEIFWLNSEYIRQIETIERIDDLNVWLTEIMHRFVSYVFDFESVKHSDVIFKAVEYIKGHLSEKISLNDVADHVFLSKSYLSRVFKQEMNCSLTSYISKLRVEMAKELLMDNSINIVDIAYMVGFEDQSYFTKVFKRFCGCSPGKFRGQRGRL